eukprot:7028786-Heterocapsa_arctica.AAC.1
MTLIKRQRRSCYCPWPRAARKWHVEVVVEVGRVVVPLVTQAEQLPVAVRQHSPADAAVCA